MTVPQQNENNGTWALDKRISLATGINLAQLAAIIWFGATFYAQVNANQARTDERFKDFAEQRKAQIEQMGKMQENQNQMMIEFTKFSSETNSQLTAQVVALKEMREAQVEINKDIREMLRPRNNNNGRGG